MLKVSKAKKSVIVLATSMLMIDASIDNTLWLLERVLCIHHLLYFRKNMYKTRALINSTNKVNTMIPAYAAKLGLKI